VTRSTSGFAGLGLAVAAFVAVALVSACSAGQITGTDTQVPAVPGTNVQVAAPGGIVGVRNAVVSYPGLAGYPAGATAPLDLRLFNDTQQAIRLVGIDSGNGTVRQFGSSPGGPSAAASAAASVSPSVAASPTAPVGSPVNIEIPAGSLVIVSPSATLQLKIVGLAQPLKPGESVGLTFRFSGDVRIENVSVSVAPPTSPVTRSPMIFETENAAHG
jgi:copper(I)-binding protein